MVNLTLAEFADNSLRFEGICGFWVEFENFHREFFKSMFYSLLLQLLALVGPPSAVS